MRIFEVLKSEAILAETDANRIITTTLQNQNNEVFDGVIEKKGRDKVLDSERESRRVMLNRSALHKKLVKSGKIEVAITKVKQTKQRSLPEATNYINAISKEVKDGFYAKNEKEASLSKFREDNKLTYAASYSDSPGSDWGYLIFAMIAEGIINSFFLSKASEFGLVGGFALAFAISLVNLSMALCFVVGLQNLRHVSSGRSIIGALGIAVSIIIMMSIALLVGHYRSALELDISSASTLAVENWLNSPLGISTFESWLLTAVTLGIFIFFVFKFVRKDDQYPGYGKITRETIKARKQYTELNTKAMKKVSQIKAELELQFEMAYEEMDILAKTLEEDHEALESLEQDYRSYLLSQKLEFETFCEECRQRFSHECTQILDKNADLSKPIASLKFQESPKLITEPDIALFRKKREAINQFQYKELEELRTDYLNTVNNIGLNKKSDQ